VGCDHPNERSEDRQGWRNGSRVRISTTRVGPLTLVVPQARDGSFCRAPIPAYPEWDPVSTELFRRYQRSEQAFVLALMEMFIQGVSTRKVKDVTEALCGSSFSKSLVKIRYRAGCQGVLDMEAFYELGCGQEGGSGQRASCPEGVKESICLEDAIFWT
jgi:hypothetical protein